MSVPEDLAACTGRWTGSSTLKDPHLGAPEESSSAAVVTPVAGGRFLRIDYTWSYHGEPQEGSLLVGGDQKQDAITAHWIDTWHMSDKVMELRGAPRKEGGAVLRGSYAAPPGPDWGWRIELVPGGGETLRIVMFNLWPDGREELAVESTYRRAGLSADTSG